MGLASIFAALISSLTELVAGTLKNPFFVAFGNARRTSSTDCKIFWRASSFLGSGPDRGRSPVEWGEIPSIRPGLAWASLGLAQASEGADRQTDRQTEGWNFSPFYRTSSPIRAAALLNIRVNYHNTT